MSPSFLVTFFVAGFLTFAGLETFAVSLGLSVFLFTNVVFVVAGFVAAGFDDAFLSATTFLVVASCFWGSFATSLVYFKVAFASFLASVALALLISLASSAIMSLTEPISATSI